MIQIGKILKQVPIFRMLGKESIDFIVERLKFKTFSAKDTICKIGDPGDEMYIIINGNVNICIYDENGENEQIVATLQSGDFFGEMALLTGETRSASVIATEDSETFVLHKNDFEVILEKFPSISLSLGKTVSKRLKDILSKAIKIPKSGPATGSQSGPSGSLQEVPMVDLISFCESNSLTGTMILKNNGQSGVFQFESGVPLKVMLGDLQDDKALDAMLGWNEGTFEITVRPLKLKKDADKEVVEVPKTILITNNSLVVRKIVERAFRGLGYQVTTAKNMTDSLNVISGQKVDIVITDIKLPDGKATDFCTRVRENADTPFIFLGDNSVRAELEQSLKEVGNAELTKTHEVSEIVKLVERLL